MDWTHLGFSEEPFADGRGADRRFVYLDATRHSILRQLVGELGQSAGLIVLVGARGMGKTTMLGRLAEEVGKHRGYYLLSGSTALTCHAGMTLHEITEACSYARCMARISERPKDPGATATPPTGKRAAVVLLDDADLLKPDLLPQLRRWRRAYQSVRGHMAIVVTASADRARDGTPLAEPGRDAVITLVPVRHDEHGALVRHRMAAAGYDGPGVFSAEALTRIAALSEGNPLKTITLCREAVALAERGAFPLAPERIDDAAACLPAPDQTGAAPERCNDAPAATATVRAAGAPAAPAGDLVGDAWSHTTAGEPADHSSSATAGAHRWPRRRRLSMTQAPSAGVEIPELGYPRGDDWSRPTDRRQRPRQQRPHVALRVASGAVSVVMALTVAGAYLVEAGYIDLPQYDAFRERMTSGLTAAVSLLQSDRKTRELAADGRDPLQTPNAAAQPRLDDAGQGGERLQAPQAPSGLEVQAGAVLANAENRARTEPAAAIAKASLNTASLDTASRGNGAIPDTKLPAPMQAASARAIDDTSTPDQATTVAAAAAQEEKAKEEAGAQAEAAAQPAAKARDDGKPEAVPEPVAERAPDKTPDQAPEQVAEQVPDKAPEQVAEQVPDKAPDQVPEQVAEQVPEQVAEQAPGKTPDQVARQESRPVGEGVPPRPPGVVMVPSGASQPEPPAEARPTLARSARTPAAAEQAADATGKPAEAPAEETGSSAPAEAGVAGEQAKPAAEAGPEAVTAETDHSADAATLATAAPAEKAEPTAEAASEPAPAQKAEQKAEQAAEPEPAARAEASPEAVPGEPAKTAAAASPMSTQAAAEMSGERTAAISPADARGERLAEGKATQPPPPGPNVEILLSRGNKFLDLGDVASARLFYRRAADRGSAEGAMLMGLTFDPVYFERMGIRGTRPDSAEAAEWYRRAREMGSQSAEERITALKGWLERSANRGDADAVRALEQMR